MSVLELFDMADRYSDDNETVEWNRMVDKGTTPPQPGLEDVKEKKSKRSKGSTSNKGKPNKMEKGRSKQSTREVVGVDQRPPYDKSKGPWTKRRQGSRSNCRAAPQSVNTSRSNEYWCPLHKVPGHDLHNYRTWQKQMEEYYDEKGPMSVPPEDNEPPVVQNNDKDTEMLFQRTDHHVNVIYGGSAAYTSKRQYKTAWRDVSNVEIPPGCPEYPKWSKTSLTFTKEDVPKCMSTSHKLPLVVSPTISNYIVGKILIDIDSSLDLLFINTLDEMQIPHSKIKPMESPFYRIVPSMSVTPIGQIVLPVNFGTATNF